jgi:hypothetical protein
VNLGSGQVYKDASGNVGIGVVPFANTLSKSLDMVDGVGLFGFSNGTFLSANAYYDGGWKYKSTAFASIYVQINSAHSWYTAPSGTAGAAISLTESMVLKPTGDLGIGTSSPAAKLSSNVSGAGSVTALNLTNSNTGLAAGTGPAINFGINDSTTIGVFGKLEVLNETASSGSNSYMTFFTRSADVLAEKMRINSGGNVGIGTATPEQKLSISGAGDTRILIDTTGANPAGIQLRTAHTSPNNNNWSITVGGDATRNLRFVDNFVGERMRLDSSGNLLVGTTSVNGRISSVPKAGFAPAVTAGTWANSAGISTSGSFGGGFSWIDGSGGYCAWVDSSGANFNIAGATTSNAVANGVFLNGFSATSWSARSDERLKQNLKPITDALNKTCSLRAVTGAYKNFPDEQQAFLLAQDVQKVLPEAVCVADKRSPEQYLGLAYTQVIPLLVAAIQELKAEVDALKGAA